MIKQWHGLGHKKQNQVLILFCMFLVLGYGFWYMGLKKDLRDADQRLKRRIDRIEKRSRAPVATLGNVTVMERSLVKLTKQVEAAQKQNKQLVKRFVPHNDFALKQQLKREIASQAESLGMRVKRFEDSSRVNEDNLTSNEEMYQQEVSNAFGRPLILFETKTSFHNLLLFLDSLNRLSYHVSPVKILNLAVWIPEDQGANEAMQKVQVIEVGLLLAL